MDFRHFLDQFWDFTLKRVSKSCDPCILLKPFGTKHMIDCKKETIFLDSSLGTYHFQLIFEDNYTDFRVSGSLEEINLIRMILDMKNPL